MLNAGPTIWKALKQKIIPQSTAEAEVISATDCSKEVVHVRLLIEELGFPDKVAGPTVLFEDNMSCCHLANSLKSRKSAKHYEIRLRHLQDVVHEGAVQFVHIGTKYQIADFLTKALPEAQFVTLRDQIMGECV